MNRTHQLTIRFEKLLIASHENFTNAHVSWNVSSSLPLAPSTHRRTSHRCGFEDYNSRPSVLILFVARTQRCPPVKTSIRGGLEVRKLDLKVGNEDSQRLAACPSPFLAPRSSLIRPRHQPIFEVSLARVDASNHRSSPLRRISVSLSRPPIFLSPPRENFSLPPAGKKENTHRMISCSHEKVNSLGLFLPVAAELNRLSFVWGSDPLGSSWFLRRTRYQSLLFARRFNKVG